MTNVIELLKHCDASKDSSYPDVVAALAVTGLASVEAGVPLTDGVDGEAVVLPDLRPASVHEVALVIPVDLRGRDSLGQGAGQHQLRPLQQQVSRPEYNIYLDENLSIASL